MTLINAAPGQWIDPEAVAVITTKTIIHPSDADRDIPLHHRITAFKSKQGLALLALTGIAPRPSGSGAASLELQMLNHLHDEAIAAVCGQRDARPYAP